MNMYHTLVLSISFLSLLFIKPNVFCFKFNSVSKNSTGFSFKLIHRDSPQSPLYLGRELTFPEKLSRYAKATDARASYLSTRATARNFTANDEQPTIGRGTVRLDSHYYYMVNVNIGTPPVDLLLLFDTASDLVWTQCKPCEKCFQQKGDMYDSTKSSDFKLLSCDQCQNDDIFNCWDDKCYYNEEYGGGSHTTGFAMRETFLFPGAKEAMISKNIVMGCSYNNEGFKFEEGSFISGILGMSLSPHSFPNQLGPEGANVFSYCLPSIEDKLTYLRFGSDIVLSTTPMQSVPVVSYKNKVVNYYGLELVDISVNGVKLNFPPGTFAEKEHGAGGCFIDTGAPMSMIDQPAFDRFITEFEKFYSSEELTRDRFSSSCRDPRQYCYYSKGLTNIDQHPNVGFHFKNGATYLMPAKNLIQFDSFYFALMIRPGDRTIIGAWQQRGVRIIHDLRPEANDLSFAFEDCDNS